MGERTTYTPGTFCWTDLATPDQEAAKAFYSDLLGWEPRDMPVGDGIVYSMMQVGGRAVAAISPQPQRQRDAGAPPAWNSYVSVQSADASAERAEQLGATVHAAPFDAMDAGRMAVIQDPQGAFFMLWQPGRHFGAALVNATGALAWNELSSPDMEGSRAFYSSLFGWTTSPFEGGPDPYLTIKNGDANNGGIRALTQPNTPPHWLAYFGIDEIDAGLAKVGDLGGGTHAGPIDIGIAKIGVVHDPQGAVFALYAGSFEP